MSPARSRALLLAAVVVLGAAAPGPAAAQVPPDEAWRTLETAHFRITFPEHLAELAEKAGNVAEQAHESLSAGFRAGPTGTIEIVLTDHVDVSNGFARYSPSNRIVLYARPPADHLALAYFDDWLEQLVVHELAHVFHLDYGGGFGGFFRAVLGRQPAPGSILTFPGRNVPGWVIEGLATWYESALTAGRPGARDVPRDGAADGGPRGPLRDPRTSRGQLSPVAGRRPSLHLRVALLRAPARQARPRPHGRIRPGRRGHGEAAVARPRRRFVDGRVGRMDRRDARPGRAPGRRPRAVRSHHRAGGADPRRAPGAPSGGGARRRLAGLRPIGRTVRSAARGHASRRRRRVHAGADEPPHPVRLPAGGRDRVRAARVRGPLPAVQRPPRPDARRIGAARHRGRQGHRAVGGSRRRLGRRGGGRRGHQRSGAGRPRERGPRGDRGPGRRHLLGLARGVTRRPLDRGEPLGRGPARRRHPRPGRAGWSTR